MATQQVDAKHSDYELYYWPGIPGGRGEFIRLAFEASGTPYRDVGNESEGGVKEVQAGISENNLGDGKNPPPLAPPYLKVIKENLVLAQTPNILMYLGPKLGLTPESEAGRFYVNQMTLTALDLNNEIHDTHHPVATSLYYEDQKEEALRKAAEVRNIRIPKFMGYFERVLTGNRESNGEYLVGNSLTYADLVLFHMVEGINYAFPNLWKIKKNSFPKVIGLYEKVKSLPRIKEYLNSEKRKEFKSMIFRNYPELDEK